MHCYYGTKGLAPIDLKIIYQGEKDLINKLFLLIHLLVLIKKLKQLAFIFYCPCTSLMNSKTLCLHLIRINIFYFNFFQKKF